MRPVAFHITARIEKEPSLYSVGLAIESVRVKDRSSALTRPPSLIILGLVVGMDPSVKTPATKTATRAVSCGARQPVDTVCWRYKKRMIGSSTPKIKSPTSAERVPVIISATTLKASENVSKMTEVLSLIRVRRSTEKGKVQMRNSPKKLRFTNVDAGLGPCAKNEKSTQNCNAVHNDEITAPR